MGEDKSIDTPIPGRLVAADLRKGPSACGAGASRRTVNAPAAVWFFVAG